MLAEFTAVYEPQDSGWIVAHVAEIPGANTQGRTLEEARANLTEALQMILECQREEALGQIQPNARVETLRIELPQRA